MKKSYLLIALLSPWVSQFSYAQTALQPETKSVVTSTANSASGTLKNTPFAKNLSDVESQQKAKEALLANKDRIEAENKLNEEKTKSIIMEAKRLEAEIELRNLKIRLNPPPAPKPKPVPAPPKPAYQPIQIDAYQGDPQPPVMLGVVKVGDEHVATISYLGNTMRVKNGSVVGGKMISGLTLNNLSWGNQPIWTQAGLGGTKIALTDLDSTGEMKMLDLQSSLKAKKEGRAPGANSSVSNYTPPANAAFIQPLNAPKASTNTPTSLIRNGIPPSPPRLN